jgi:hypothetical protein
MFRENTRGQGKVDDVSDGREKNRFALFKQRSRNRIKVACGVRGVRQE